MKKIETLLWSMLLTVFSTQTVFADSFTSADEAAFIFANGCPYCYREKKALKQAEEL